MAALMTGYAESGITTGKFVRRRLSDGAFWNTSGTPGFQAYSAAAIANYGIAATEITSSGVYTATDPAPGTPGDYLLVKSAGASLAVADLTTGLRWQDSTGNTSLADVKAKTDNLPASPAAVGSAMTLTTGERTAIANEVEAQIIDETDSEKVLAAITDKIASVNPSLAGLTLAAIASQVRTELTTELSRLDTNIGSRMATFVYTAPDNTSVTTILGRVTGAVALASTALSNAVWTNAKAAFLDAPISGAGAGFTVDDIATAVGVKITFDHGGGSYIRNTEPDNASIATILADVLTLTTAIGTASVTLVSPTNLLDSTITIYKGSSYQGATAINLAIATAVQNLTGCEVQLRWKGVTIVGSVSAAGTSNQAAIFEADADLTSSWSNHYGPFYLWAIPADEAARRLDVKGVVSVQNTLEAEL